MIAGPGRKLFGLCPPLHLRHPHNAVWSAVMNRGCRTFWALLTALAVFLANASWAIDSAALAHGAAPVHAHPSASKHSSATDGYQHDEMKTGVAAHCADEGRSGCEPDGNAGDRAQSCCGTIACHAVIPATSCETAFTPLIRSIRALPFDDTVKQQMLGRLDRPPRSAGV
ncbi:hypothetical protein Mnod_7877 (plasmid) [Methylobacterium nodulans ORS 2060]|uniref:Uncharacterized protein n=1 Tax=Methylobacterium nodulans (strain LMG 21967 / CNCM I-2342 / ORS 2060) TaxID=460265 RepID=B8IXR9_METNO|nr:hypothetical protein Mnod_7877 [Methylobacterium nodulans ORS 2060]